VAKDQPDYEEKDATGQRGVSGLAVAETLRSVSVCKETPPAREGKSDEKISIFWRVFGGTLLSISALVIMTAYTNLSGSISDLRKDINQEIEKRSEYARKDDLNSRVMAQWSAIKDIQTATGALGTVGDRVKVLDQQMERVARNTDDDRRDLRQKLEEQRKQAQDEKGELTRKIEDQRRAFDDERKDLQRRIEDQRKSFEDERRDVLTRLQALSERLAAVEARTTVQAPKATNAWTGH
jgi:hypothetical protein